jgi:hypothetical protein
MLNEALNNALFAETLLDIGFNTLNLMNSTYPSTIWDKSSASYAHALVKYSVSGTDRQIDTHTHMAQGFL